MVALIKHVVIEQAKNHLLAQVDSHLLQCKLDLGNRLLLLVVNFLKYLQHRLLQDLESILQKKSAVIEPCNADALQKCSFANLRAIDNMKSKVICFKRGHKLFKYSTALTVTDLRSLCTLEQLDQGDLFSQASHEELCQKYRVVYLKLFVDQGDEVFEVDRLFKFLIKQMLFLHGPLVGKGIKQFFELCSAHVPIRINDESLA